MMRMDFLSEPDRGLFAGPPEPGIAGMGGDEFSDSMGSPARFASRNPTEPKPWGDGEIYRAITMGMKKSREPVFPVMPWTRQVGMAEEDIQSVIGRMRPMAPLEAAHAEGRAGFPRSPIERTLPTTNKPGKRPKHMAEPFAQGQYPLNTPV